MIKEIIHIISKINKILKQSNHFKHIDTTDKNTDTSDRKAQLIISTNSATKSTQE